MMELGVKLKEARESKELTLEDVQRLTKIQKRYLEAIEDGNLSIMPGKFYTRAFIRQYAEAVGLDPEILMDEYKSELPASPDEEYVNVSRTQTHRNGNTVKSSAFFSFLPKLMVAILIIGILVAGWYFYQKKIEPSTGAPADDDDTNTIEYQPSDQKEKNNSTSQSEPEPDQTNVQDNSKNEPEPTPEPELEQQKLSLVETIEGQKPRSTYELSNAEGVKLRFQSNGRSYLGVENGKGASFYATEINEDNSPKEFDLSSEQEINLNIGRAYELQFSINGVPFEYPVSTTEFEHQYIKIIVKNENQ